MSTQDMNPEEKRWWSRFKRVLRDMPETIEIQVHQGFIEVMREGAIAEEFERTGDSQNISETYDFVITERVRPCSESI